MSPRSDPGIITVRPFEERDLDGAAELCDRARAADVAVEPFSQRLAIIATGPRALLPLWRVAEGEDGQLHGLAFAALREARQEVTPPRTDDLHFAPQRDKRGPAEPALPGVPSTHSTHSGSTHSAPTHSASIRGPAPRAAHPLAPQQAKRPPLAVHFAPRAEPGTPAASAPPPQPRRTSVEVYAAVMPALRRQGLGRQLLDPALGWAQEQAAQGPVALRARVRDLPEAKPGLAFLRALGFAQVAAQLSLSWSAPRAPAAREVPTLRLTPLDARDKAAVADFERLSNAAWEGAEEAFPTRADELQQLIGELDRLILIARIDGKPAGYLSAMRLGRALGIEEVAVMAQFRRYGIGRELVIEGLRRAQAPSAVLTVSEKNRPARALYKSLGFAQSGRRVVFEWTAVDGSASK